MCPNLVQCRHVGVRRKTMTSCLRCGTEFVPKEPSRPARFCSLECGRHSGPERPEVACTQCGKSFSLRPYRVKQPPKRGYFCNFACYGAWQSVHIRGSASPSYVEDTPVRLSTVWRRRSKEARQRDGYRCQRCGSENRKTLAVHHIEHWAPGQLNPHRLENLVTLCRPCHGKVHPPRGGSKRRASSG